MPVSVWMNTPPTAAAWRVGINVVRAIGRAKSPAQKKADNTAVLHIQWNPDLVNLKIVNNPDLVNLLATTIFFTVN